MSKRSPLALVHRLPLGSGMFRVIASACLATFLTGILMVSPSSADEKKGESKAADQPGEPSKADAPAKPPTEEAFGIGSMAPSIDVEYWIDDSKEPVTKFESGKVYVVEFWATWCGPCIYSMPHLAAIQRQYADQGVRVISISDEPLETVTEFCERTVSPSILNAEAKTAGEESEADKVEVTFGQLTSAYSLTTDPDESVYEDYMRAANQNGIPTAFIVGTDGYVEWIGHPMQMDQPLANIVAGDWDREAAKVEFFKDQERSKVFREIMMAQRQDNHEAVTKLIKENSELFAGSQYEAPVESMLLKSAMQAHLTDEVVERLRALAARNISDLDAINTLAWEIWTEVEAGYDNDEPIVTATIDMLEKSIAAVEAGASPDQIGSLVWAALDTLAHFKAHVGETDEAIKLQSRAIELAPEDQAESLREFLKQLQK